MTASSRSRLSLPKFIGGIAIVALAHMSLVFAIYRARVLTHSTWASSDLILFVVPVLLAFASYFLLLRRRGIAPVAAGFGGSFLAFLSLWIGFVISTSFWGT